MADLTADEKPADKPESHRVIHVEESEEERANGCVVHSSCWCGNEAFRNEKKWKLKQSDNQRRRTVVIFRVPTLFEVTVRFCDEVYFAAWLAKSFPWAHDSHSLLNMDSIWPIKGSQC